MKFYLVLLSFIFASLIGHAQSNNSSSSGAAARPLADWEGAPRSAYDDKQGGVIAEGGPKCTDCEKHAMQRYNATNTMRSNTNPGPASSSPQQDGASGVDENQ